MGFFARADHESAVRLINKSLLDFVGGTVAALRPYSLGEVYRSIAFAETQSDGNPPFHFPSPFGNIPSPLSAATCTAHRPLQRCHGSGPQPLRASALSLARAAAPAASTAFAPFAAWSASPHINPHHQRRTEPAIKPTTGEGMSPGKLDWSNGAFLEGLHTPPVSKTDCLKRCGGRVVRSSLYMQVVECARVRLDMRLMRDVQRAGGRGFARGGVAAVGSCSRGIIYIASA